MKNIIIGFVLGVAAVYFGLISGGQSTSTEQDKIAAYYSNSAATLVSPHNIRERMSHGKDTYVLVDVRAEEDYLREHIVTAINIDTGRELDVVLLEFKQLIEENPNKEIIIYCYSAACMNGRKAGNFLADNGVYVKEMTIGWNEWRYGWEMWNYDTEWADVQVEDFVVSGSEPGTVPESAISIQPCSIEGELSC
ncbi:MAG: rhodanese-related sulfurtransferase [Candidatus Paceibacteria bacterium]|jgi:rhodanese-related sulfurtransferase